MTNRLSHIQPASFPLAYDTAPYRNRPELVQETRQPLPVRPGVAMAYDYEYRRNGGSNLFMLYAPLEGWRRVEVTERRTRTDWAEVVRRWCGGWWTRTTRRRSASCW